MGEKFKKLKLPLSIFSGILLSIAVILILIYFASFGFALNNTDLRVVLGQFSALCAFLSLVLAVFAKK